MIEQILEKAGFIRNETYKKTRFLTAPKKTYCIYTDAYEARGADGKNMLREHHYTIELYSYHPDEAAEEAIEQAFDALGIAYEKQPRYWIEKEKLYQVIYEYEEIEKRRT